MYPILFEVGGFEITSFGAMVALAALVGYLLFQRELRQSGLPETATDAVLAGLMGGIAGAKLLWVLEHLEYDTWTNLLFSRAGMSWFGGFAGGLLAASVLMRRRRLPLLPVIAAATPALAIGHAIGRVGCLLVGDDYGIPSTLPWAMAFPQGLPPTDVAVHPTQIYEAIALVPIAIWLVRLRRRAVPDAAVIGTYLLLTASVRFLIQWIRVYDPVVGPLGFAHLAALLAMAAGAWLLVIAGPPPARPGTPRVR
jgi:phosphatidylglycerol---prolipoprotein diacylglyceryl transferase